MDYRTSRSRYRYGTGTIFLSTGTVPYVDPYFATRDKTRLRLIDFYSSKESRTFDWIRQVR